MEKNAQNIRVIVSGGGTGGHIFPAIAIANAIKTKYPSANILFVGAKGKMEMEKVPDAGYPIEGLWISGIQRKLLSTQNLTFPFKVISSLSKSRQIIKRFKPDLVIGVGGFASGPLLKMATWMKLPTLIQEQNSYPGITNKWLSKGVDKICVAYEGLERFFPKEKIIFTGNPVRASISTATFDRAEALKHFNLDPNKKTVFVTGGSLGARGINEGIKACLETFRENKLQLIWQAGKLYIDEMQKELKPTDKDDFQVMAFVKKMEYAYSAADVIVARAGASTIAELGFVGKPVILMPSPNVAEDHQTANAQALVVKDAAKMVKDKEAKEKLASQILAVLSDEILTKDLSENIEKLAVSDAAETIATEALELI